MYFADAFIIEAFDGFFSNIGSKISNVLPQTPEVQSDFATVAAKYLGWLNWCIPVGAMVDFLVLVLAALAIYYAFRFVLKWVT